MLIEAFKFKLKLLQKDVLSHQDDRKDFDCPCNEVTVLLTRPMLAKNANPNEIMDLRNKFNIQAKPNLDVVFYFEAAAMAIKAVG